MNIGREVSPEVRESERLINRFGAQLKLSDNWGVGVYFLPDFFKAALVAIHQLPLSEETLWLRLLGRDATQRQAVEELVALPLGHPQKRAILELVANWRITVAIGENLTHEDQELIMNLSPAYLQWREATFREGKEDGIEEGREEGREEGKLEERRQMVENFLKVRFGEIDEALREAIAFLLPLPVEPLTRLLLTASREEIITQFRQAGENPD